VKDRVNPAPNNHSNIESSEGYSFGPFRLDVRKRRVWKGDQLVALTPKAFDTLLALLRQAGQVVERGELLRIVWPDTFVTEETLTQNIATIRRALGDSSDSPNYLLTVPREGYRFIAPVEVVRAPRIAEGSGAQREPLRYVAWAAAGLVVATLALVLYLMRLSWSAGMAPVSATFEVFEPEGSRFSTSGGALSISPDGRHLAFLATDADGTDNLWMRPVGSLESTRLPGTAEASQPFWSADAKSIAFFAGNSLRRIDISDGLARMVCPLPGPNAFAGSWSSDGLILFAVTGRGLFRVEASGGSATPVNVPGMGPCRECLWPSFLPGGRQFLFAVVSAPPSERGIYIGSLDGAVPRRVVDAPSSATYTEAGYLLYGSAGALVARRFDPVRGVVGGDVIPIADRVWYNPGTARAVFSVSDRGMLAYREPLVSRLQWISRTGTVISSGPDAIYHSFSVSRDGRVLASQLDPLRGTYDLWLHDPEWRVRTRLTFDPASDLRPLWSEDESAALFAREGSVGWQLYELKVDTPGVERPLLAEPSRSTVGPVSWNGDTLEYSTFGRSEPSRLWIVRPGKGDRPKLVIEGDSNEGEGRMSPDGKWLAYTTHVTDSRVPHTALFVRPWYGNRGRSEIAQAGSVPRWRSNGRELFFIAPGGRLMVQRLEDGRTIGAPVQLCTTEALATSGLSGQAYDAAPDGLRFLVKVPARRPSIVLRTGWLPRPGE
jgi:DNA-binding winged helix-turn-helix (wHTH) protein/Tol biopolymer transport system component